MSSVGNEKRGKRLSRMYPAGGWWDSFKPLPWLAVRLGALLTIYMMLDLILQNVCHLSETSYRQPVILFELLGQWFGLNAWITHGSAIIRERGTILAVPMILVYGMALIIRYPSCWRNYRALWCRWSIFVDSAAVRPLILVIAFLATWLASTYDYNLYFNQAHYADRFLLILLVLLVSWRPVFVFPFLFLLLGIFHQFSYPYENNPSWPELNLLIRALALFGSTFLIHVLTGRRETVDFAFALCCLVASSYWGSGIGKFQLNWISHPYLHLLVFGAYANGWLGFWESSTITVLSKTLSYATIPLMVITLLLEWGSICFLWKRSWTLVFLAGFILFHAGIFFVTGMFFWKWILVELALIVYLTWSLGHRHVDIFSPSYFALSIIVIAGSPIWFQPTNLSWYDTRVTYLRSIEAIGESGSRYQLSPQTFTPYRDLFTLGPFSFLSKHPQLTGIWGITSNRAIARKLVSVSTPRQVFALEEEMGSVNFNEKASAKFDEFIVRFIGNLNERRSKRTALSMFQPPPHLWTCPKNNTFRSQERIRKVIIYEVTFFYDGTQFSSIRQRVIRVIDIPVEPNVQHRHQVSSVGIRWLSSKC
ncbi:MAG: hypothetical protein O6942_04520 [Bacteroidetes bacterium]|nr:hypothetical protein [Bacteroidota bacterium]